MPIGFDDAAIAAGVGFIGPCLFYIIGLLIKAARDAVSD